LTNFRAFHASLALDFSFEQRVRDRHLRLFLKSFHGGRGDASDV
jgi:hypothetical protein